MSTKKKIEEAEKVEAVVNTDVNQEQKPQEDEALKEFMKFFVSKYPENKVFYITSDKNVFLEHNKQFAVKHQRILDKGELTTYKAN